MQVLASMWEIGQEIKVKLTEVDKKTGKFRLSQKVLLPRPPREERPPRNEGNKNEQ